MTKTLCAILLAAGNSSRFGSNKLLYPINNQPMYQHTIKLFQQLNTQKIILITKYPEIIKKIDPNIHIIINNDTHLGQSHSMKLALKYLIAQKRHFDGYLFSVCDQPYLQLTSLIKLSTTWQAKGGICALATNNKRGNPIIFSQKYLPDLLNISGDTGGRSILHKYPEEITLVETTKPDELIDIDTPEILEKISSKL